MAFYNDLQFGRKGEELVMDVLRGRGHQIEDVSGNKDWQRADVDFLCDGLTCELKTDRRISITGNLFLEDYCVIGGEYKKCWFRTTAAEFLFYLDWTERILYIYRMEDLRNYIDSEVVPQKYSTENNKKTYGYCLDKDSVKHQIIHL